MKLADIDAERNRIETHLAIRQMQQLPSVGLRSIQNIALEDDVATTVPHGLGREPAWVCPSAPRGPASTGRIEEIRDGAHDRRTVVVLKATGWGATITIDLGLF